MPAIDTEIVINGYAWIEGEEGELVWAYKEELQDVKPEDRPEGATPVVIEIYPVEEWIKKKQADQEYFSSLSEQLERIKREVTDVERDFKLGD